MCAIGRTTCVTMRTILSGNARTLLRMNTTLVKVKHMIHVVMAAYMILTGCSNTQRSKMLADGNKRKQSAGVAESPEVTLPSRSFNKLLDGSLQSTGHWKLKVSEAPSGQLPFGAQPLNSTMRIGNSNGLFTPPRRPRPPQHPPAAPRALAWPPRAPPPPAGAACNPAAHGGAGLGGATKSGATKL